MRVFIPLLFAVLLLAVQPLTHARAQTRPNIIVIMTDDQNADTIAHMPILQTRLMAEGVTFSNAYSVTPLCCPSRVSVLTGQYIHNHGVVFNYGEYGGFERAHAAGVEASTLATWLNAAGYHTALVGKYLNGYPQPDNPVYVPPGWDEWYAMHTPPAEGEDYYFNFALIENGVRVQYGETDYLTDVLTDKAIDVIERAVDTQQPFFIHITPFAPHDPYLPAPRHAELFRDLKLPRPPSFNEADVTDKPQSIRDRPRLTSDQIHELKVIYRHQIRTLQAVDEMVGRVIDTLDTYDVLNDTYIVYLSDNGFHLGTHRLTWGKSKPYIEDLRVPLIVRGAGIQAGVTEPRLVATIDLAPTIAEWAGITPPDTVDGRSLVPLLTNTPIEWRTVLLSSFICPGGDFPTRRGCFNSLITAVSSYVEYPANGEFELYDLVNDPYQLENKFSSTAAAKLDRYATRLKRLLQCSGATCRTLDDWNVP